ncbi:hypothetical protein [Citrobacter sp. FP75]|uniref:hypothetical protein n=1 Tax=Citrobacter sp. FP75 TaxID=1852949 RepID=UPI001BC9A52E|nr:hypothetical protein [Citrobacter sp. FP75]
MDELPYSRNAERAAFVFRPSCCHHRAVQSVQRATAGTNRNVEDMNLALNNKKLLDGFGCTVMYGK